MNKGAALLGLAGLSAGMLLGYVVFHQEAAEVPVASVEDAAPLFYRNPMNPEITSPVPAQDPMGMDYIPVYKDAGGSTNPGTVKIDPVVQANIGLRTAMAQRKAMSRTIRTLGRVDYDEANLVRLHPKVEGWIRNIRVDKTGQPVADDEILLSIYSPKLVATQKEYLLAMKNQEALKNSPFDDIRNGARALVKSSRERLVLLDVPEHQIVELEKSQQVKEGLHIHAPAGGTVLRIGARQGQFVTPATELYLIADLETVWVYADIYDYELPWVQEGDPVEMTLSSVPGRIFRGELAYIFPYAEAKTRTTKVRLVFDNSDLALRPEMFADVTIHAAEKANQIVVPAEAVVRSGDYNQIFVVTPTGAFEPRKVQLGIQSRGEVSITEGIKAGERVVVSAQFLLDSESSLREATAKMLSIGESEAETEQDHDMSGMEKDMEKELSDMELDMSNEHSSHEAMKHD
jgi:Cu(I)/Ag(I) efflux system membrane fusion protein